MNTASRMESTSEAMKVHISQYTKDLLGPNYRVTERGVLDIKGKGSMKTYWLDDREHRKRYTHINTPTQPVQASMQLPVPGSAGRLMDRRRSVSVLQSNRSTIGSPGSIDDRRIYSPVTFEDVALRSIANSPVRTLFSAHRGRESRSNSTGHVFMQSPSDVFGSLINDTEDFLEDLQIHRVESKVSETPCSAGTFKISSPITTIAVSPSTTKFGNAPGLFTSDVSSDIEATRSAIIAQGSTVASNAFTLNVGGVQATTSSLAPSSSNPNRESAVPSNRADPKRTDTLDHLDQLMDDILDNQSPAMCPFKFGPRFPPTSSKSDGQLCRGTSAQKYVAI